MILDYLTERADTVKYIARNNEDAVRTVVRLINLYPSLLHLPVEISHATAYGVTFVVNTHSAVMHLCQTIGGSWSKEIVPPYSADQPPTTYYRHKEGLVNFWTHGDKDGDRDSLEGITLGVTIELKGLPPTCTLVAEEVDVPAQRITRWKVDCGADPAPPTPTTQEAMVSTTPHCDENPHA